MRPIEELESARDVKHFKALLDATLPGDCSTRAAVADLLDRLPATSFRKVVLIAKCGEYSVAEAIPQIRATFATTGKGLRDARVASLYALDSLLDPDERTAFLVQALDDRDSLVAEAAAIRTGFSDDRSQVSSLLAWLEHRLTTSRSRTQAHVTAEIVATCLRLGDAEQVSRMRTLLKDVTLAPLEQRAADRKYRGQRFSEDYPVVSWPD